MQKTPFVYPIIGGRKLEHLQANIEAVKISLTDEQVKYLEGVLPFDPGFPNSLIVRDSSPNPSQPVILTNRFCVCRVMDRR